MRQKLELLGVLAGRGFMPDALPSPHAALMAGARYFACVASEDGSISLAIAADHLETVLFTCTALQEFAAGRIEWTAWLAPTSQAAVARLGGEGFERH